MGAAVRAGLFAAGLAPTGLALVALGMNPGAALFIGSGVVAVAAAAFLIERRDDPALLVLGRAVVAGALVSLAAPLVSAWIEHPGAPDAAVIELSRSLRQEWSALLALAVGLVGTAPAWGLVLLVRGRTLRAGPQVLAGALTFGLAAALMLHEGGASSWPIGLAALLGSAATGALAALGPALVDRVPWLGAAIGDPLREAQGSSPEGSERSRAASPSIRCERPVRPLILAWLLVAPIVATGAIRAAVAVGSFMAVNERAAIDGLKQISSSQQLHRDRPDGLQLYAASLDALPPLPGCPPLEAERRGYRFRVALDPTYPDARWCADATPIVPGVTGERCFFINQAGCIGYRMAATASLAELDPSQSMPPGYIVICK